MRILFDECNRCGKCETECHKSAIDKDQNGMPCINEKLCDECNGLYDAQCVRVCSAGCIVKSPQGSLIARINIDNKIRLRPDHLLYTVAILGSGNSGRYLGGREWAVQREIIAKAFLDPKLEIRIVPVFDDACIGCSMKKDPTHRERLAWEDKKTLDVLGLKYGQDIQFWDAVAIARKKISAGYLKSITKFDEFINDFFSNRAAP